MVSDKEIIIPNQYPSVNQDGLGDFRFIILERFLSYDNEFSVREGFILNSYFSIIRLARSDSAAYGIDSNQAVIEKVPLVVAPLTNLQLTRIRSKIDS
jgi:KUP system potassium uptake protein